jgi:predicted Ser/Thr protein kinase
VVAEAIEQPPDRRRAWVARACDGNPELAGRAVALLDAYEQDPAFLEDSAQFDPADLADALDLQEPSTALAPGTILGDGQYQIVGEIGRGGMGIVYVAQDLRLPRRVALKSLPDGGRDPVRLERLRREAWAAARISHPAVATVFTFEELGGEPFIVSEYVRGRSLRRLISEGALEPGRAVAIAIEIAGALAAAHEQGVVHRDLKPENVLLTDEGRVKVVDFGVAQLAHDGVPALTRTGAWLGTPAYMAPEQTDGNPVDGRADIFSFGLVLAEMLTGVHPLRSRLQDQASGPGPDTNAKDALHGPLAAIVKRCLQVLPSERYDTARALLHDLGRIQNPAASPHAAPASAVWWWAFHQVAAAAIYIAIAAVAWQALDAIGRMAAGLQGLCAVTLLASVIVATVLRLNLWFTSRHFPDQLDHLRRQRRLWILTADLLFIAVLVSMGALMLTVQQEHELSLVLLALGIGVAVAVAFIEPVTTRAAFQEAGEYKEKGDRR